MVGLFVSLAILLFQILGFLSAIAALRSTRTSQGTIAWIVSLLTFPYLAVPLFWIFGRTHFHGYVRTREEVRSRLQDRMAGQHEISADLLTGDTREETRVIEKLARVPFTNHNETTILVDGDRTFSSLFTGMRSARTYILAQFYIIRDDRTGREFASILSERARAGVSVSLLYDEIGCYQLPRAFLDDLRQSGVTVYPFQSSKGRRNRFQVNFRNHRKIVVVDGRHAWVGGLNIGDEYRGMNPRFGSWRDTHLRLSGPAVLAVQFAFLEDWHWSSGGFLELSWVPFRGSPDGGSSTGDSVAIVASGPTVRMETASLLIQHMVNSAHRRLWITSPYFVPDEGVQSALKLAVLKGVDVRILIPQRPDHLLVYLSAFAFLGSMVEAGVKIYRYQPGFLHEKVFLVDDEIVGIGTVNLDNRSFRLNFEITAVIRNARTASSTEAMLTEDFSNAIRIEHDELSGKSLWFRLLARAAYLTAPVL